MKKIILMLAFTATIFSLNAQKNIEVKINPIGFLFGRYNVSGEYLVNEHVGIDVSPVINNFSTTAFVKIEEGTKGTIKGFGMQVAGKYYMNPDQGCDKFGIGMYASSSSNKIATYISNVKEDEYKQTRVSVGFLVTYKWVSNQGVTFEVSGGGGRNFLNKLVDTATNTTVVETNSVTGVGTWDTTARLAVGYRFGGKK